MKKSLSKILLLGIALLTIGSTDVFAAKKKKEDPLKAAKKAYKPIKDPTTGKKYNLKGMEVIVADWWSPSETPAPTNAAEEARANWLAFLEDTYNFTIKQVGIDGWGKHPQTFVNFATNGGSENYVFVLYQNSISAQMKAGLMYDLATLPALNLNEKKWQKPVQDAMTMSGHIYGMRGVAAEPRGGLFFNKRMLKEAGIDPDSLYDMQKNGTWTWSAFEKICSKILRDTNNDGIMDVYPMINFNTSFYRCVVASNDAAFISKDAKGNFINATTTNNFLEAMNWGTDMVTKYELPVQEGAKWDYCYSAFINGEAAMQADEEYRSSSLKDMKDDYGFVCFPKGPKAKDYVNYQYDNAYVIPACYDKDRANKIAFAYNMFTEPTPGYEDDDSWKNNYYAKYRDTRAVDETLDRMRTNGVGFIDNIVGVNVGDIIYGVYARAKTPAEAIEEVKNSWQATIDEMNGVKK